MRRFFFVFFFFTILRAALFDVNAQSPNKGEITNIRADEVLRGIADIRGTTAITGVVSWELAFGYANDTTGTWFLIAENNTSIQNGLLADWDTTLIADGNYNLRLTLFFEENRRSHLIVENIRVRNYTAIETLTPTASITPTPFTETPVPSQTPTPTVVPTHTSIPSTPTPLPTNPVEISHQDINNQFLRGAAGAAALFIVIGLYGSIRQKLQR